MGQNQRKNQISPLESRLTNFVLVFPTLYFFVLVNVALHIGFKKINGNSHTNSIELLFIEVFLAVAFTLVPFVLCWGTEKPPLSYLGIKEGTRTGCSRFLEGLGISGVLLSLIFVFYLIMGWIKISSWWQPEQQPAYNVLLDAFLELLTLGVGAWVEEIVFRGYIFQALKESLNNYCFAIIISSAFFGYIHTLGHEPFWGILISTSVTGVFLALGRYFTQSLWLSIGLHFGWNVFQGIIFGFKVSGNDDFLKCHFICQDLTSSGGKQDIFTGGEYGPEGGIIAGIAAILGCIALYFLSKRLGWSTRQL